MKHRHPGPKVKYRTRRGSIKLRKRPKHKMKGLFSDPSYTMNKDKRKIFQNLDKYSFETGGNMDFNKKGLERSDIYFGDNKQVEIWTNPDYEVDWHTHPSSKDKRTDMMNHFPSKDDLTGFKNSPSQYSLIFHNGRATGIRKLWGFKPSKRKIKKIEKELYNDAEKMKLRELYQNYKPKYEKLGLKMDMFPKGKPMTLPINIIEGDFPDKKITKKGIFFGEPEEYDMGKDIEEYTREVERQREERDIALNLGLDLDQKEIEQLAIELVDSQRDLPIEEQEVDL